LMPAKVLKIQLTLIGGFEKDVPVERSVGSAMGDVRFVEAETEIRAALKKKGSRYGDFAHPYVIGVVDCKDELSGGESNADDFIDALDDLGAFDRCPATLRVGGAQISGPRSAQTGGPRPYAKSWN